jgi:hypothetical protein
MDSTTQIGFARRSRDRPFTLYYKSNSFSFLSLQIKEDIIDKCCEFDKDRSIHNFKGCLYRLKQINLHLNEMEILAQPLCETLLPLDAIVFTPTIFRHTKRLPISISKPSHKKFHFKNLNIH